jgi:outer membrane protein, heavy metal efflux system
LKAYIVKAIAAALLLSGTCPGQERRFLSMADAERIALENHPSARLAEAELSASRGRFWRGISPPPPSLSVDYSYVPTGKSLSSFGEKNLEINQTIEFPLTTIRRGNGLSHEISARENEVRLVQLEVVAAAKLAYIEALAAQQRLALARDNLSIAESFLRDAATRKNVGEGTQLELLTAQTQRVQAANAVETASAALSVARSELGGALGWSFDSMDRTVVLSDSLVYRPVVLNLDSLHALAPKLSPEIAANEERLGGAEAERSAAWMSVLPSLTFSYYRQTVGNDPNLYGMKFGISLPIWFFLDNRGQVEEASAGVAMASEALRFTRTAVSLEISSAYTAYANSRRQVELQQREMLPQAEEVFRAANVSYHAGEATYVEFLQALQTLNSARNGMLDALVGYNGALIRLEKTLGHIE